MEAIFPIIFLSEESSVDTLWLLDYTRWGCGNFNFLNCVVFKCASKKFEQATGCSYCLVCAHTRDHVHTCCMLVAVICKMISLI